MRYRDRFSAWLETFIRLYAPRDERIANALVQINRKYRDGYDPSTDLAVLVDGMLPGELEFVQHMMKALVDQARSMDRQLPRSNADPRTQIEQLAELADKAGLDSAAGTLRTILTQPALPLAVKAYALEYVKETKDWITLERIVEEYDEHGKPARFAWIIRHTYQMALNHEPYRDRYHLNLVYNHSLEPCHKWPTASAAAEFWRTNRAKINATPTEQRQWAMDHPED
jgi:hypothetical protein